MFLLSRNNRYVLIDTGTKRHWKRLERRLDSFLQPGETIEALILTHVHFDHAANAARVREKYKSAIIVNERESELLSAGKNAYIGGATGITSLLFHCFRGTKILDSLGFEPSPHDITVRDHYSLADFGFNASIIQTPGHTLGSMSVLVDDEIALAGDALFGVFPNSVFSPWAADKKMMIRSWKLLLDAGCGLYLPSHGKQRSRQLLMKQYGKYSQRLKTDS